MLISCEANVRVYKTILQPDRQSTFKVNNPSSGGDIPPTCIILEVWSHTAKGWLLTSRHASKNRALMTHDFFFPRSCRPIPYLNLYLPPGARGERIKCMSRYGLFYTFQLDEWHQPIIYGWMINGIQAHGVEVQGYAWQYVLAYMGLKLLEWGFHGPPG